MNKIVACNLQQNKEPKQHSAISFEAATARRLLGALLWLANSAFLSGSQ
jgi:hypothetical protein